MDKFDKDQLPDGMYMGGFKNQHLVFEDAIDKFGLSRPLTIYYPASSSDVSMLALEDTETIHVDVYFSSQQLDNFSKLGSRAIKADAYSFLPERPVDILALINASGLDTEQVFRNSRLRIGGLVVKMSEHTSSNPPEEIRDLQFIGAVVYDEDGQTPHIDSLNLNSYYEVKDYNELSQVEQESFKQKVDKVIVGNIQSDPEFTYESVYDFFMFSYDQARSIEQAIDLPFGAVLGYADTKFDQLSKDERNKFIEQYSQANLDYVVMSGEQDDYDSIYERLVEIVKQANMMMNAYDIKPIYKKTASGHIYQRVS